MRVDHLWRVIGGSCHDLETASIVEAHEQCDSYNGERTEHDNAPVEHPEILPHNFTTGGYDGWMTLDISSTLAKIVRAKGLLDGLDGEVRAWQDTKPYTFTDDVNAQFTRYSKVAHVHNEPPITRWSLIIADIFHNLRCSLDHLVYAIAVHESADTKGLQFPICDSSLSANDQKRIASLSKSVRAAIESMQPYNRGNPSLPQPPLTILRDIDNTNKHRLLKLAMSSVYAGKVGIKGQTVQEIPQLLFYGGNIKDGTQIMLATFAFPQPNVKLDILELKLIIALKHAKTGPHGGDRDDYGALLDIIIDEVRFVVESVVAAVP